MLLTFFGISLHHYLLFVVVSVATRQATLCLFVRNYYQLLHIHWNRVFPGALLSNSWGLTRALALLISSVLFHVLLETYLEQVSLRAEGDMYMISFEARGRCCLMWLPPQAQHY
jgi:hypothetical protein